MFYEYKCPHHGPFLHSERDENKRCPICDTTATRKFSFSVAPSFREGYSPTTGQYVSNESELKSQLDKASEKATARNDIPHKYVPVDLRDKEACGVTDEHVEAITKFRSDQDQFAKRA